MGRGTIVAAWLWLAALGGAALVVAGVGSARAQDCVHVEQRFVRGMFLCGVEGELRLAIHNDCDADVRCTIALPDARGDREEVDVPWRGTYGTLLAGGPRASRACIDEPRPERPIEVRCEPGETSVGPAGRAPGPDPVPPPAPEPAPAPELAASGPAPIGSDVAAIALAEGDGAYRGPSWHVRWLAGAAFALVPLVVGRASVDPDGTVHQSSEVTAAPALTLATRLEVQPYAGDVLSVGAFVEGEIGGLSVDDALSLVLGARGGIEVAIGYRYAFALLEGSLGGRVAGIATQLDVEGRAARGGYGAYGFARLTAGVRACFGLDGAHGCVAGIDLRAGFEDLDLPDAPWRTPDPVPLVAASLWIAQVLAVSAELAWEMPPAGTSDIEAPEGAAGAWWLSLRVQKPFEWFGRAYELPEVGCDPRSLSGLWQTRDGRVVLVDQRGLELVVRTARGEARGVVSGEVEPGARVRIGWSVALEDAPVDELEVVGASALAQDEVIVLRRICSVD